MATFETIEAQRLIIRAPGGRVCAALEGRDEGPALGLMDKSGELRLLIAVEAEGPRMVLYDHAGGARLGMTFTAEGGGAISFLDQEHERLQISVPSASGGITISDAAGTDRVKIGVDQNGDTMIKTFQESGEGLGDLLTAPGGALVILHDSAGRIRCSLGSDISGGQSLTFFGADQEVRAAIGEQKSGEAYVTP